MMTTAIHSTSDYRPMNHQHLHHQQKLPSYNNNSNNISHNMAHDALKDFHKWNADQLGQYFQQHGLGQYSSVLMKHKITGALAPLLTDQDLKDMGVHVVGDRLLFKQHLQDLARRARYIKRIESLWEGKEQLYFSDLDRNVLTCCGAFPTDPSTYKLTTNHLKVKKVQPVRCGPFPLWCFGVSYASNNIDLSKVDDVDVFHTPAPCCYRTLCCAAGKDLVEVESRFEKSGKIFLILPETHGEVVANLVLNQVEESQKMERS